MLHTAAHPTGQKEKLHYKGPFSLKERGGKKELFSGLPQASS